VLKISKEEPNYNREERSKKDEKVHFTVKEEMNIKIIQFVFLAPSKTSCFLGGFVFLI